MKELLHKAKRLIPLSLVVSFLLLLSGCGPGYYSYESPYSGSFAYESAPPHHHHYHKSKKQRKKEYKWYKKQQKKYYKRLKKHHKHHHDDDDD